MKFFQAHLQRGVATRNVFSPPGEVTFVSNGMLSHLSDPGQS